MDNPVTDGESEMSGRTTTSDSAAVTDTQALLDDLEERGYKLTVGENGTLCRSEATKGPPITPVIYWALQANYRKLVKLLSPPVTHGESEMSARAETSRSLTVTPEMKRLDEIRRRQANGTDIATADEARRTAQWCTLCGASLSEKPVYHGRVRVSRTPRGYSGRDQKVPLCAECWYPHSEGLEASLEECDTCGRKGYFYVAPGRPRFCCARCKSAYYNSIRNARSAESAARQKSCQVCGALFTAKRNDAKTCSPKCKQKAYRLRSEARAKAGKP
jgi:hypothetical protein